MANIHGHPLPGVQLLRQARVVVEACGHVILHGLNDTTVMSVAHTYEKKQPATSSCVERLVGVPAVRH